MIHPAINKTEIAFRYYEGRGYSRETARKMFNQDKKKDLQVVKTHILEILKEQKEMLKKTN